VWISPPPLTEQRIHESAIGYHLGITARVSHSRSLPSTRSPKARNPFRWDHLSGRHYLLGRAVEVPAGATSALRWGGYSAKTGSM